MLYNIPLTDFHSHILPGADHGSTGPKMSENQLNIIADAGISCVVATPHFYPNQHQPSSFIRMRDEAVAILAGINMPNKPEIICGAEVLVCEGLEEMSDLDKLCIAGTKVILLEMPMKKWNYRLLDTVYAIHCSDLVPVIAHVDRYVESEVDSLFETGVKAQLNVASLCSFLGRRAPLRWVREGRIVAIGSDLHGADRGEYKCFQKACRILRDSLPYIMEETDKLLIGADFLTAATPA